MTHKYVYVHVDKALLPNLNPMPSFIVDALPQYPGKKVVLYINSVEWLVMHVRFSGFHFQSISVLTVINQ